MDSRDLRLFGILGLMDSRDLKLFGILGLMDSCDLRSVSLERVTFAMCHNLSLIQL